jgi:hypothetical protein
MLPKVYGDKSEVVMSGPNGGPVQTETKLSTMEPIEASQAYQRMMRGEIRRRLSWMTAASTFSAPCAAI